VSIENETQPIPSKNAKHLQWFFAWLVLLFAICGPVFALIHGPPYIDRICGRVSVWLISYTVGRWHTLALVSRIRSGRRMITTATSGLNHASLAQFYFFRTGLTQT
jgi:hypothetical protein